jgi:hypothetical protein
MIYFMGLYYRLLRVWTIKTKISHENEYKYNKNYIFLLVYIIIIMFSNVYDIYGVEILINMHKKKFWVYSTFESLEVSSQLITNPKYRKLFWIMYYIDLYIIIIIAYSSR